MVKDPFWADALTKMRNLVDAGGSPWPRDAVEVIFLRIDQEEMKAVCSESTNDTWSIIVCTKAVPKMGLREMSLTSRTHRHSFAGTTAHQWNDKDSQVTSSRRSGDASINGTAGGQSQFCIS